MTVTISLVDAEVILVSLDVSLSLVNQEPLRLGCERHGIHGAELLNLFLGGCLDTVLGICKCKRPTSVWREFHAQRSRKNGMSNEALELNA